MYKLRENILDITNNYYNYLLSLKNVNGLGFGFKKINNKDTIEPCIHVLVEEKIKEKYLTSNNLIPKRYMGIKTDVIETGKIDFCLGSVKLRPLEGGCGIATSLNQQGSYGSLGCIVTKKSFFKKQYFILSNNHVIANGNETPLGTPILQPSKTSETEWSDKVVAHLSTFIALKDMNALNSMKKKQNYLDCALAKVVNKNLVSNKIIGIGEIKGVSKKIDLGLDIKMNGATSGLVIGKIKTLDAIVVIKESQILKGKSWFFKDQIIANLHVLNGDSGSLILNFYNEAVGLLWAGSTSSPIAYINNISKVLNKLKVSIYL